MNGQNTQNHTVQMQSTSPNNAKLSCANTYLYNSRTTMTRKPHGSSQSIRTIYESSEKKGINMCYQG